MFDFTTLEWIVFALLTIVIHVVGFYVHRQYIIQRLMVIREELDRIKLSRATGQDTQSKHRELELMERAEYLLATIGIDP